MQLNIEIEVQDCETLTLEIIDAPIGGGVPIDDDAGIGDTDVTWSADKSSRELADKVDKVAGYSLVDDDEIAKLLTVEQDAQMNTVSSVAGKQGDVLLDKSDVGLGAVDNTADADKPVSTAVAAALVGKVDKVVGKQLSDESFTLAEKTKLSNIETEATKNRTDAATDALLLTKVDKVAGSGLITDAEKARLSTIVNFDNSGNVSALGLKVDKEAGKSLIADSEISRLAGVSNYNDAPLALRVTNLESSVGDIDTALAAILGVTP